ncbi:uncharacterized protein TM35_000161530 [Trypanosoma theileri]|uniref:Uncharacterized protein n=1 Tax=Trypanosoma theileri TaxID=67003 RepID=A0A1X0NUZ1_9TRYP|nr:uncharacterized protein TM35_000161530 [Trypanosoma theileri]ORC88515.1 hypothetical protein TM35_000161530 [Trypanosoma theileri]
MVFFFFFLAGDRSPEEPSNGCSQKGRPGESGGFITPPPSRSKSHPRLFFFSPRKPGDGEPPPEPEGPGRSLRNRGPRLFFAAAGVRLARGIPVGVRAEVEPRKGSLFVRPRTA